MDLQFLRKHEALKRQIDDDFRAMDGIKNRKALLTSMVHDPRMADTLHAVDMQILELESRITAAMWQFREERSEIERFISGITDSKTRLLFTLRYIDMLSWRKVAAVMECSDAAIRKRRDKYLEKQGRKSK